MIGMNYFSLAGASSFVAMLQRPISLILAMLASPIRFP
jgi:hypothetical protein